MAGRLLLLSLLVWGLAGCTPRAEPPAASVGETTTPTTRRLAPTPWLTATFTATATPTATPTSTSTPTATATPTVSATPTPAPTPTFTATVMPTVTPTPKATLTPAPPPTFTATMPPASPPQLPTLSAVDGDLANQVARLETNLLRPQSEAFVVPAAADRAAFAELITKIEAGEGANGAVLAAAYAYELVTYTDRGDDNAVSYLLREEKPFRRGWGLYLFRAGGGREFVIEAPHPRADQGTPMVALALFRALDGRALLLAGAHRDANANGAADMAHNPQTIFQTVHETVTAAGAPVVLQIHGFAAAEHPGYPQVVVGGTLPAELRQRLVEAWQQAGLTVGVCAAGAWRDLCGETNVQRAGGGVFIHLEMDETVRAAPAGLIAAMVEVFKP